MRSAAPGFVPVLEICVDSPDGLAAAIAGGADRIELCSALEIGGLTPCPGLMAAAARAPIPAHAMIRCRPGDFVAGDADVDVMRADVEAARGAGLAGIVIGASRADGTLDEVTLATLIELAGPLETTLHRVFDLVPDPFAALDRAVELGLTRILSSGQALTAAQGCTLLSRLVVHAATRIELTAGGGITPGDVTRVCATGVDAVHASCREVDDAQADLARLGIGRRRVTGVAAVSALRSALTGREART